MRDTKQLVQNLEGGLWNDNMRWLTCDVTALYPSLPHDLALKFLFAFLCKHSTYSDSLINYMLVVLEFLLHSNYFSFNKRFYLQKQGAPMGAKFSPSLSNLYLTHWEETYLFSHLNPFSSHISRYFRYIDNLLLVWEGSALLIPKFVDFINDNP